MELKAWIQAFRLRTLPLAFSSIFLGSFLASSQGMFDGVILAWSLITTLFLQVLSNLANDYGDATSGVDGDQRTGPKRTVSAGLISKKAMKRALIVFSVLSLASGFYLTFLAFGDQWAQVSVFVVLGIAAVAAAIKYTVGKNPYGYAGFGDFFVLLFFGFVGVGGSYYLYTHALDWAVLLPAASCGLLAVGVLNVNNIRDIESDQLSGKYSIPVRIGRAAAVWYQWLLLALAVVCMVVFFMIQRASWESYVFLLCLPLLGRNAWAVKTKTTSNELDPYLKQLALTTLLFVLLVGLGLYLG
ncbi:1,4-dihydroxy-2-naphthoate polyprenyltransferase [Marinoscillum furvescens]|uniref:1,4-dihydroxy-2-naphthoate octaprenyltransferase n=1 Tax=Marinoscillum furvescens DSM 4134 TaxID=1122208 RepID=A0A3D9L894_MARFU|nr:1,4-dihydroxy-2-naphthoate polyprenyltransferase [Marinoscillum furvescens]REE02060.1 1,4-dihydroxy-2-naphthoate prenyltransferase [Marinoscillum furvescens DSM 4134]